MVISFLIIYCNVVLPNALKGFLFFIQVASYVHITIICNVYIISTMVIGWILTSARPSYTITIFLFCNTCNLPNKQLS